MLMFRVTEKNTFNIVISPIIAKNVISMTIKRHIEGQKCKTKFI